MLRIITRALAAGLTVQGAFMTWVAHYGVLWQYGSALGWFALHVLRPGMYAIGTFSVVMGLWYAWLAYTRGGRALARWAEDMSDRFWLAHYHEDRALRYRRVWEEGDRFTLSQEESDRLVYEEPAEQARANRFLSPADALRTQAGRCAEAGLHDTAKELRDEAERMDREEPDDGCFTQGSDAVTRASRCDKEG